MESLRWEDFHPRVLSSDVLIQRILSDLKRIRIAMAKVQLLFHLNQGSHLDNGTQIFQPRYAMLSRLNVGHKKYWLLDLSFTC